MKPTQEEIANSRAHVLKLAAAMVRSEPGADEDRNAIRLARAIRLYTYLRAAAGDAPPAECPQPELLEPDLKGMPDQYLQSMVRDILQEMNRRDQHQRRN